MEDTLPIILNVLMLFTYLLPGYILGKTKLVDDNFAKGLSVLLLYIAAPLQIISSCMREFIPSEFKIGLLILVVSTVLFVIQYFTAKLIFHKAPSNQKPVLIFASTFGNCGYLGIPILKMVFGDIAVLYGAFIVIAFNILQWSLGAITFSKGKIKLVDLFVNPGTIGSIIGIVLFLLPIHYPDFVTTAVNGIAVTTAPLSMILIGITLSQVKFKALFSCYRIYLLTLIRMIIFPILIIFILLLFKTPTIIIGVLCVVSGMPAATSTTMFALKFNGDVAFASKTVLITVLFGIITLPVLLYLLTILVPGII